VNPRSIHPLSLRERVNPCSIYPLSLRERVRVRVNTWITDSSETRPKH